MGAFAEATLIIANIGTATALYTVVKQKYPNLRLSSSLPGGGVLEQTGVSAVDSVDRNVR